MDASFGRQIVALCERVGTMKLSIIIICWNDLGEIGRCLESVYAETTGIDFEVIVTDNGSTDGSVAYVRKHFPNAQVVESGANLGFGGGNNRGFGVAKGEYVLILNPDTVIRDRAIEKMVAFADRHPQAGAFGCRVLNADGSYQTSARPLPTVWSYLIAALYLRGLGRLSNIFLADTYVDWEGTAEREIGFQAGCCILVRGELLKALGGFDERLFHQFEDADLCLRIWKSGNAILYYPGAEITHIGGQNRGRYPIAVILETHRSRYRFFYKHYGKNAVEQIRWVSLISFWIRLIGYSLLRRFRPSEAIEDRLRMYRVIIKWHWQIEPVRFVECGEEPETGYKPLAPAPKMAECT
jgi:N-acetylglucosaminyl-diphospho-decaprenol L-rhamnosyltransferase